MTVKTDGAAALVLFAHGSRDPQWAEPFRSIQRTVAAKKPALTVELAFLEMMKPALAETIERLVASGHARVTIAPVFMAQGAHLKRDLAEIMTRVREHHPGTEFVLLPAIGESIEVRDIISSWVAENA